MSRNDFRNSCCVGVVIFANIFITSDLAHGGGKKNNSHNINELSLLDEKIYEIKKDIEMHEVKENNIKSTSESLNQEMEVYLNYIALKRKQAPTSEKIENSTEFDDNNKHLNFKQPSSIEINAWRQEAYKDKYSLDVYKNKLESNFINNNNRIRTLNDGLVAGRLDLEKAQSENDRLLQEIKSKQQEIQEIGHEKVKSKIQIKEAIKRPANKQKGLGNQHQQIQHNIELLNTGIESEQKKLENLTNEIQKKKETLQLMLTWPSGKRNSQKEKENLKRELKELTKKKENLERELKKLTEKKKEDEKIKKNLTDQKNKELSDLSRDLKYFQEKIESLTNLIPLKEREIQVISNENLPLSENIEKLKDKEIKISDELAIIMKIDDQKPVELVAAMKIQNLEKEVNSAELLHAQNKLQSSQEVKNKLKSVFLGLPLEERKIKLLGLKVAVKETADNLDNSLGEKKSDIISLLTVIDEHKNALEQIKASRDERDKIEKSIVKLKDLRSKLSRKQLWERLKIWSEIRTKEAEIKKLLIRLRWQRSSYNLDKFESWHEKNPKSSTNSSNCNQESDVQIIGIDSSGEE